jgi:hypothetical protein
MVSLLSSPIRQQYHVWQSEVRFVAPPGAACCLADGFLLMQPTTLADRGNRIEMGDRIA